MSWEDVPLYSPGDKKETFQVILNVDGLIIFQYKELQHVDSYVKAGIEDERGKEGIGISQTSLANGKAYEIVRVVQKLESPPAEKVTITSKTSYVYGNGQLWVKLEENPLGSPAKPYYYHNDHLGSARAITDKDDKVVEQYFYYPFGGGGPTGGPTFTGKELDETGLFYFGARYYNPALGRFIQPDPVENSFKPEDLNKYVYCYNNPFKYIDPTGMRNNIVSDWWSGWFEGFIRFWIGDDLADRIFTSETRLMFEGFTEPMFEKMLDISTGIPTASKALGSPEVGLGETTLAVSMAAFSILPGDEAIRLGVKGWKLGDPVNKLTRAGKYPSWSAVRARVWKNEALKPDSLKKWGVENVERMKKGLPPHRINNIGKLESLELHHIKGRDIVDPHNLWNLELVWPIEHAKVDPFRYTGY
ncbi:MAG: RHS repeat-associated core domain-containing protein [bacterium]